jgi:hypothetical protein
VAIGKLLVLCRVSDLAVRCNFGGASSNSLARFHKQGRCFPICELSADSSDILHNIDFVPISYSGDFPLGSFEMAGRIWRSFLLCYRPRSSHCISMECRSLDFNKAHKNCVAAEGARDFQIPEDFHVSNAIYISHTCYDVDRISHFGYLKMHSSGWQFLKRQIQIAVSTDGTSRFAIPPPPHRSARP